MVIICDKCETDLDVSLYCVDCKGNLCSKCAEKHGQKRLTKTHKVVKRIEKKSGCHNHQGSDFKLFCKDCKVPCCHHCVSQIHEGHHFTSFSTVASSERKKLEEYTNELKALLPNFHMQKNEWARQLRLVKENKKINKAKVRNQVREYRNLASDMESNLLQHLEYHHLNAEDRMEAMMTMIDIKRFEVENMLELCKNQQEGSDVDLIIFNAGCPDLKSLSQLPTMSMPSSPDFVPTAINLPLMQKQLGEILLDDHSTQFVPPTPSFGLFGTVASFSAKSNTTSLAPYGKQNVLLANVYEKYVSVYNMEGTPGKQIIFKFQIKRHGRVV